MRQKRKSQSPQKAMGICMSVLILVAAAQLVKADLTSFIFGAAKEPAVPTQQIPSMPSQPMAMPAQQTQKTTDTSGYEHYTDKNGNEVVVVPARYEASSAESAPIQAAPQQTLPQRSPLPSQQMPPATVAPIQAARPINLASVAMNAANANTRMNVFESCRCNNGIATKGDSVGEVLEKCAQPAIQSGGSDCSQSGCTTLAPMNSCKAFALTAVA